MPNRVELEFAAKTDPGRVRPRNEDAIAVCAEHGVAILADGMGGYNAGEVASAMTTAILKESLEQQLHEFDWNARSAQGAQLQRLLIAAIERANTAILQAAHDDSHYHGMGTTVVAALFHHDKVIVAHVGDSRCYRWRQGELALLTRDHSFLQEQVDAGLIDAEQARLSPNRNLITRALGIDASLDVEVHEHVTQADDLYLLCSDGLSDMLANQEIINVLQNAKSELDSICDTLIQCANANGGRDNISVILARTSSNEAETARLVDRILKWMR